MSLHAALLSRPKKSTAINLSSILYTSLSNLHMSSRSLNNSDQLRRWFDTDYGLNRDNYICINC